MLNPDDAGDDDTPFMKYHDPRAQSVSGARVGPGKQAQITVAPGSVSVSDASGVPQGCPGCARRKAQIMEWVNFFRR